MTAERVWIESSSRAHMAGYPERPCWQCQKLTAWTEYSFEAPLCPGQCTEDAWAEYDRAIDEGNQRMLEAGIDPRTYLPFLGSQTDEGVIP